MSDLVLRGGEVVFPDRKPAKHDILVEGGKIIIQQHVLLVCCVYF